MKHFVLIALACFIMVTGWALAQEREATGAVDASTPVLTAEEIAASRAKAYQLYEARRFQESADQFEIYLEQNPGDAGALYDYSSLLIQLERRTDAARQLELLRERFPQHETGYFKLGVTYLSLKRPEDARRVFSDLRKSSNPAMAASAETALEQLETDLASAARIEAETRVYALAEESKHAEVVAAVNRMETDMKTKQTGAPSLGMLLQRLYSWIELGEVELALNNAEQLTLAHPESIDLILIRADLLIRADRPMEAARILQQLKQAHPGTPVAAKASARLSGLPPRYNPEKRFWGEAYSSGDYLGRYGTVVGSGFVRQGAFVPKARWLQPYGEFRYGVDTRSDTGPRETIIADNAVGFYGGARAQLFGSEYLFAYGQGGVNKDLLDVREDGDFALDYQAGLYGFKSWGPGTAFRLDTAHELSPAESQVPGETDVLQDRERLSERIPWIGDWFVDVGANFSYYHRYRSWIGYGQSRQGFRLLQFGPRIGVDGYLVENLTWDVHGNYFDNSIEFGPGTRLIWLPRRDWQVVLRVEWLQGFYFGRDDLGNRGGASSEYDGVQVGLAVGARW